MTESTVFELVGWLWQRQKAKPSTPCKCLKVFVYLRCITNTYQKKSMKPAKDYQGKQELVHPVFLHELLQAAPEMKSV